MNTLHLSHLRWFFKRPGVALHHKRIVDVGGGGGELATLANEAGASRYLGVDVSLSAIHNARQLAPEAEFIVHDARACFPQACLETDIVAMFDVVEHVSCPEELFRVLEHVKATLKQRLLFPVKIVAITLMKALLRLITGEKVRSVHPSIYFVAVPREPHALSK